MEDWNKALQRAIKEDEELTKKYNMLQEQKKYIENNIEDVEERAEYIRLAEMLFNGELENSDDVWNNSIFSLDIWECETQIEIGIFAFGKINIDGDEEEQYIGILGFDVDSKE